MVCHAINILNILNVIQRTGLMFNSFEVLVLNVTLPDVRKQFLVSLALVIYVDLTEFADFLSDLLVNEDTASYID